MISALIALTLYVALHIAVKRAVENYDGEYGQTKI
jgi:hypothetical protein